MDLEIIARRPASPRPGPKLLLVHGICVGAWIWDEFMLPALAEAGHEAYAVSLRGHGNSPGRAGIAGYRLADYVQDLDQAVARLSGPVVVIGHSLGGAVVQSWVRGGGRPVGMGLLASVPPWGLAVSTWRMALAEPALMREVMKLSTPGATRPDPAVMRRGLFSDDVPEDVFARFLARSGPESGRIGFELQGWSPLAPLPLQAPATFVLGGADDRFVPASEVSSTGLYYGAPATIVPQLAHTVMLEPRWRDVLAAMLPWLAGLAGRS